MSLLLALPERGLPVPAGAVLMCPWVDLTGWTQRPPQDSPLVFSPDMAHRLAHAYLAGQPADDPLLNPLHTSWPASRRCSSTPPPAIPSCRRPSC